MWDTLSSEDQLAQKLQAANPQGVADFNASVGRAERQTKRKEQQQWLNDWMSDHGPGDEGTFRKSHKQALNAAIASPGLRPESMEGYDLDNQRGVKALKKALKSSNVKAGGGIQNKWTKTFDGEYGPNDNLPTQIGDTKVKWNSATKNYDPVPSPKQVKKDDRQEFLDNFMTGISSDNKFSGRDKRSLKDAIKNSDNDNISSWNIEGEGGVRSLKKAIKSSGMTAGGNVTKGWEHTMDGFFDPKKHTAPSNATWNKQAGEWEQNQTEAPSSPAEQPTVDNTPVNNNNNKNKPTKQQKANRFLKNMRSFDNKDYLVPFEYCYLKIQIQFQIL